MKKLLPIFVIVAVFIVFFQQFFFQQLLPIPSDTIIGLYNPFRDLYAKNYPRGIPFKNFLITDPVRQQYPWRFESILEEKLLQLPLWNPYNFAGTPLLANGQSAALYPLNIIFFLIPFPVAWSLLIFLQPLLAGIFMFLYLRSNKLHTIACLLGSIAFSFSGFFVAWLEWGTVAMTAAWLPLILLSIDKIFLDIKQRSILIDSLKIRKYHMWFIVYTCGLIFSLLAGHLQTFFYIFLVQLVYISLFIYKSKQKKAIFLFIFASLFFLMITAIQWIPLFQLILNSARDVDRVIDPDWFLPWQHIVNLFVPDFFGNPTTLNYWGIWNYVEFASYIGLPALFFAVFALGLLRNKKVLFFIGVLLVSFIFILPTFIAYLPFQFHLPFISTSQPTRMIILIDFSLSVLAGFGMNYFLENKGKVYIPLLFFFSVFAALWAIVVFHTTFASKISLENILIAKHNLFFSTAILFVLFVLIFLKSIFYNRYKSTLLVISLCLLLLSTFDSFRFAQKFTPFTPEKYLFPETKSLQFLVSHAGISRIMTTDNQILPPNFSLMYHLQSLDGYDPLYIKNYGSLIAAMERNRPDIKTPFGFNRLITPHNFDSRIADLLGVKYVLSLHELQSPKLKKVFTEGQTIAYENKNVFPRAFFVKNVTSVFDNQQAINFLFDPKVDLHNSAVIEASAKQKEFSQGQAKIDRYSANRIVIYTQNKGEGFLVLTDTYYPTWHAYVDGKETKIYPTDLALRGIIVPEGTHVVTFSVQLW